MLDLDTMHLRSGMRGDSAQHRLVRRSFDRARHVNEIHRMSVPEQRQLLGIARLRQRDDGLCHRGSPREKIVDFFEAGCAAYHGAFRCGPQQKHLVCANPFILQKIRRMRARDDLAERSPLQPSEHLGHETHNLAGAGTTPALRGGRGPLPVPSVAHNSPSRRRVPSENCSSVCPGALRSPVLVTPSQVRRTPIVAPELPALVS